MGENDNFIDPNYVDPSLLAQYDEPEPDYSSKSYSTPQQMYQPQNIKTDGPMLDQILSYAINMEASDVHLLSGCQPLVRISKELTSIEQMNTLTPEDMTEFITQITGGKERLLDLLDEQRLLDINYKYESTRFRVNISYSMDVPTITMRIIKDQLPPYDSLNLPPIIKDYAVKSQGLILVTGKPGSGKSTTLSTLVNEINENENKKILMLENPIEYVHSNKRSVIVQKEISPYGDCRSFHEGVVNSLREDCDVLVIGEIRDKVTMDAAIEMAETGHLVLGTIHTNSCSETIDRIINFYPTEDQQTIKFMLANALKLVVSQRMLRGGYGNLVMIPEILVVDDQVGGMIKKDKFNSIEIEDIMQSGRERGNYSLVFSLADAVLDGKITLEQAYREVDFKRQELLTRIVNAGRQRKYY